jgi:Tfp pilus assembly protein PilF
MKTTVTGTFLLASLLSAALVVTACGPDKPAERPRPADGNETPTSPSSASATPTQKPQAAAPSNGDVKKGMAALESGDLAGAKASFEAAVAKNKEDPQAHYYLGVTLNQQKDDKGAERELKEALRIMPDLDEASSNLSALYLDQQKWDDAASVCKAALVKSKRPELHANYAMALAGKNDTAGAKKEFDEAARGGDAMILFTYATYLEKWKELDAATEKLRAAAKAAPDDAATLASIGFELKNVGAFADCVSTLDRAIAKKDNAEIRTYRALCKLGNKDKDGARADLESAVKLDPSVPPPHFYLAGRLAEGGKLPEAIAEFEAYLKLAPQGPLAAEAKKRIDVLKKKGKK